ncbi:unnamed protein product [Psylliodes chrysocephalus]|uniref:Uncharacterized protein n=1 Tax=Psylliodes chrysocephalus TaxID=3402493 RepID=A0A9P0D6A0_9CUCU|nr:unnamed protein product [Psylliodes chrysocephala]
MAIKKLFLATVLLSICLKEATTDITITNGTCSKIYYFDDSYYKIYCFKTISNNNNTLSITTDKNDTITLDIDVTRNTNKYKVMNNGNIGNFLIYKENIIFDQCLAVNEKEFFWFKNPEETVAIPLVITEGTCSKIHYYNDRYYKIYCFKAINTKNNTLAITTDKNDTIILSMDVTKGYTNYYKIINNENVDNSQLYREKNVYDRCIAVTITDGTCSKIYYFDDRYYKIYCFKTISNNNNNNNTLSITTDKNDTITLDMDVTNTNKYKIINNGNIGNSLLYEEDIVFDKCEAVNEKESFWTKNPEETVAIRCEVSKRSRPYLGIKTGNFIMLIELMPPQNQLVYVQDNYPDRE